MWLNGFNNNLPGYPKVVCSMVKCPDPYMGLDQPGTPPDSSENLQDPFGSGGESFVRYGLCPVDQKLENEDEDLRILAHAKLHSYDRHTHGHFFWNFRTEVRGLLVHCVMFLHLIT
jgi:glucan 1,3-beta-glucosidase